MTAPTPPIPQRILERWRGLVETLAQNVGVCAGRITRVIGREIDIVATGGSWDNPYLAGERAPLDGLYCGCVAQDRAELVVTDARVDSSWLDSADVARGMISYFGVPLLWPDGSLFGAIDLLDRAPNAYSAPHRRLVEQFAATVEDHLALIQADTVGVLPIERQWRDFRQNEETYRLLIDNSADDFVLHDEQGRILDVNQQACKHTGYSRDELLAMTIAQYQITYGQRELEALWSRTAPGVTTVVRTEHKRKDGSLFPVEVNVSCVLEGGRKLFFSVARDISERVGAEQASRQLKAELEQRVVERTQQWRDSTAVLQAVMDGATDAIFVKDLEGRFLLFNRAAAKYAGRTSEEVLGKTVADIFGEATGEKIREYELEVMRTGVASTVDETIVANGVKRLFLATRSPYRDENGNVVGLIGISRDITEMRRAEEALRESEARWQFALDGAGYGVWDWNRATGNVFYSHQWKAMLGYEEQDIGATRADWSDRVHPDDLPQCLAAIDDHLRGETADFSFTHRMRAKDGSWKWILSRGKVIERTAEGEPLRAIGAHTDVTADKIVEDELRVERERLMLATESGRLGVWDYDLDANTILGNDRWREIFGITAESSTEAIEAFNKCVHPDDVERVKRERRAVLIERPRLHRLDFRIITAAGETRWITSSACLIGATELTPNRLVGVVMDVTESRLAESRLQESYESLRQAEKLARIGSWSLDLATAEFSNSDMLYELNGMDPAGPPLTPAGLQKLLSPEGFEKVSAAIANCVETGEPYAVDVEHMRPDGSSFAAQVRGRANRDASGKIVSLTGTVQDISERHEAQARLAALADNLPSGAIYRVDRDRRGRGAMIYMSAGIQALIGVPAEEIVKDFRALQRLIHEDDLDRYLAAVEVAVKTHEPFDTQFRVRTRDGRIIWMQSRSAVSSVRPDGSSVWDGVIRDITKETEAAQALRQAKDAAERAERAKSDFLATMSHEIRTPMNTVIGMTRLTLQTDLAPKQRNYLEKIDTSAKTLLSIINDILDFSKIEAGKLDLEDTEFTLESVLESVSAIIAMRAEEKGLEIAYTIAPDAPRRLRGDPLRLGQVLTNLVGNAVKFTHEGEVVVSIRLAPGDGAKMLEFAVRDTGIGLDANQIAGLFRPFSQADSQTSRRYGGTGLGLAISKQLIERMGGSIEVESEPGRGSTFRFTIAVVRPGDAVSPDGQARRRQSLDGRRVLIVDDNASAREILVDMVGGFGMSAKAVDSGSKALAALRSASRTDNPFDLVLMDWRMPTMDGLETARRIRADETLPRMPAVLMVTAYGREEVLQRVEQLGLNGLLIKPITESVMFNTILDILSLSGANRPPIESEQESVDRRGLKPRETLSMLAGRRVLVVDDNAFNREVACDFLLAVGMEVDTAINGVDALKQLERHTYEAVLMDMHMPEMDGLAATLEIRKQARWSTLPIIALTAQARIEDRNASLEAGMTAHLTKPIDEMALYRTLVDVLTNTHKPAAQAPAEPEEVEPVRAGFDLSSTLRRLGGDPNRVDRLLRGFLRDFADAPVRLQEHLVTHNIAEIAALAHTMKGAAGYFFGARAFCESAERLEQAARRGGDEAVGKLAPEFRERLRALLEQVSGAVAGAPSEPVIPTEQGPAGPALALIAQAEPLIARGDYAAQGLLERISALLTGRDDVALLEEVRMHYEELDLEAAGVALRRLKASFRAEHSATP